MNAVLHSHFAVLLPSVSGWMLVGESETTNGARVRRRLSSGWSCDHWYVPLGPDLSYSLLVLRVPSADRALLLTTPCQLGGSFASSNSTATNDPATRAATAAVTTAATASRPLATRAVILAATSVATTRAATVVATLVLMQCALKACTARRASLTCGHSAPAHALPSRRNATPLRAWAVPPNPAFTLSYT